MTTQSLHSLYDRLGSYKVLISVPQIPPLENFPAGRICVIVHRIISPPNGEPDWERYITSGTNLKIAEAQARGGKSLSPDK